MYDERIESLINAALADGQLSEKEKQILFKNAQEQGIDLDEFEMVLNARLTELNKKSAQASQASAPKSNKFGDIRKCPSCGAILQSFQTKCDTCGYEFKNVGAVNSAQKLFDLLQAAELRKSERIAEHNKEKNRRLDALSQRHNSDSSMVKILAGNKRKEIQDEEREDLIRELNDDLAKIERKANEEQANIIKNFPVPNTTEDLLELLAMATSNAYDNDGVIGAKEEVWLQKTDQIYQKIIVCANNDKPLLEKSTHMVVSLMKRLPKGNYKKFTTIPQKMKDMVEEELRANQQRKKEKLLALGKKYGIIAAPCFVVGFVLGLFDSSTLKSIGSLLIIVAFIVIFIGWRAWRKLKKEDSFI